MENDLVRYSRAGDEFHYRWAARRCLKLIYPKSSLQFIVIEGSGPEEHNFAGEYVIDVAEYSQSDQDGLPQINYYQLKHTTIQNDSHFTLSDLESTIAGFAARYAEHFCKDLSGDPPIVTFSLVTNRPVSEDVKQYFSIIGSGNRILRQDGEDSLFQKTVEKYTQLVGDHLQRFCALVEFVDGEGDYNVQREELRAELSLLLAGTVDDPKISNIVELVRAKVMPDSDGRIVREDLLKRLGITSEQELYPAPPEFEELNHVIKRKQHDTLLNDILQTSTPIVIHAGGGVGKSVVARQLSDSLPSGSLGIVYDCFGGGKYRNRSELRHRHRDALVQIANELASYGLCAPLIAESAQEDQIMRQFLRRIHAATQTLREANENALLAVFIDAADNAEMAAQEFGHSCFAHELLREQIPDGCRIVALCRTERVELLQPSNSILQIQLEPFDEDETQRHLEQHALDANNDDAIEFHRLTSGNPRVQANALEDKASNIAEILTNLGPSGTTVENQIAAQLDSAVAAVKDKFPLVYQNHIDAICTGLAILPPFIPLMVLAAVADVHEDAVKSFVADIGRPLWLSNTSVQFRDEPTETWFRETFSAEVEQIAAYAARLKPLAQTYSYVAEALPLLLLQAEQYEELVSLALSDNLLPTNPIDERNVRIYRLQFAFKAALKLGRYADATKLALRAGEEVAGDKRQFELLAKNVDLIAPLQDEQRVQELAFRRLLRGNWDGSENLYSAALLSSVEEYRGEARGYLRSATKWLRLYFEERKKSHNKHREDRLQNDDLFALLFAHYKLLGPAQAVDFLLSFIPPEVAFCLGRPFIRRLIDAGDFDALEEVTRLGSRNQYLMIASAYELLDVGRFPTAESMQDCLVLLTMRRVRIEKPRYSYDNTVDSAILAFVEACAARKLPKTQILRVLRHYFPVKAPRTVSSEFQRKDRDTFLRAVALRCVLTGTFDPDLDELLPEKQDENTQSYDDGQSAQKLKAVIGAMLPWYILRARLLTSDAEDMLAAANQADQLSRSAQAGRWRDFNTLSYEISQIHIDLMILNRNLNSDEANSFLTNYPERNGHIWISDYIKGTRAAFRSEHLVDVRRRLEKSAYQGISSASNEGPAIKSEWYIDLARAVLPADRYDAAAYFDHAIEAVSKFGDEIIERWEAVAAVANRTSEGETVSPQMAYRFIRCAELIGDNVAREKYFDRDGAVKTCARFSPSSAFAALSRWRDRNVGWFYRQLTALAYEIVDSEALSPAVGWSLSAFFNGYELDSFASLCILKERSASLQQLILEMAVRDLRLNETEESSWRQLEQGARQHRIDNDELNHILTFYADKVAEQSEETPLDRRASYCEETEALDWDNLLNGLDLTSSSGLSDAIQRFDEASTTHHSQVAFWQEIYNRIDESDAVKFLWALADAERANKYDIQRAISDMPSSWREKASVRRNWESFLRSIAQRFASVFTNRYILRDYFRQINVHSDKMPIIHQGIIDGLSSYGGSVDASTFFGFVGIGAGYISSHEASELLNFALERFELHIDGEYADGKWADWLVPPDNISEAFAGFVWAALGSPRSEIRWRAAHCVRRLAQANCVPEIDALIEWMNRDEVGAFGSHEFPFYNLHARQYLLMALARVAVDHPDVLKHHHRVFAHHALSSMDHVLIQKYATEIALNIETSFPNTYDSAVVEQLRNVGMSPFEVQQTESFYKANLMSPWHERGDVNSDLSFLHGYDFDRYWFEPLGQVFGISGEQVEDLATEVVVNEWQAETDGSFYSDPRARIWRRDERETWHDHGSYPRSDNLSFYLSYHSMFVVASRLLQQMPVVNGRDWYEDEWQEWLQRHLLTRSDGYWLSDRRDPAPLARRAWLNQAKSEHWRWEIVPADFLDGLFGERNGELWLNVWGWWQDSDGERREEFRVSSALVSPSASQSLLNALTTCPPDDFSLPEYEEERGELDHYPFKLSGWVWYQKNVDARLDEFDPHAGTVPYPPYQIGESIAEVLHLSVDSSLREWYLPDTDHVSAICELWGTNKSRQDEDPLRQGQRLSASLAFLRQLCVRFDCEIIFKIQITRRLRQRPYSHDNDRIGYVPPYCKVYLLSADGELRDTQTHLQLRQSLS